MTSPWRCIVPIKRLDRAKSRLRTTTSQQRADFALAFALDTVSSLIACESIAHLLVVTDDERAAKAVAELDVAIVNDLHDAGLNPALTHGAQECVARWGDGPLLAISSDLPAVRPSDLEQVLPALALHRQSFVADQGGTGSTIYAARSLAEFAPLFGTRSRAEHRAAGAVELFDHVDQRLRRDVDTEVDLWDAQRLGVGPHTHALLND